MTWGEWTSWFAQLLGLTDKQLLTVGAWVEEVFVPGGATPDELRAAALDVVRGGPPKFLNELLPALLVSVKQARADALLAREEQEREGKPAVGAPVCRDCDGSGWAVVPARPAKTYPSGALQTCAVACSCIAGVRIATVARNHRKEPPMDLAAYERLNPGWREELDWHRKQQRAKALVEAGDGREWAELMERMRRGKGPRRIFEEA